MRVLTAYDGNLIVVAHITKVWYGVDHAAYETASLQYIKATREIAQAARNPELEKALRDGMESVYPNGRPAIKDFYRTRVTLPDGSNHWVKASRDDVVRAVLDA